MGLATKLYWSYEKLIKKAQSRLYTLTGAIGCINAFRRELYHVLPPNVIEDFTEPLMIVAQGYRIVYEEDAVSYERTTQKPLEEFHMRVRVIRGGMKGFLYAFRKLTFKKHSFVLFQLIGHKVLRWLMPIFLILLFLVTLISFLTSYNPAVNFLMIAQLVLLFAISPQYRFFMNFIIFFGTFCFVAIVQSKKIIQLVLAITLIPIVVLLFVPINLGSLSANKAMVKTNTISLSNIFFPSKISNSISNYKVIQLGNLRYNSPLERSLIWATGDIDLPCVSTRQIKLHRRKFKVIPQLRTGDLKDGFYSKRVEDEN